MFADDVDYTEIAYTQRSRLETVASHAGVAVAAPVLLWATNRFVRSRATPSRATTPTCSESVERKSRRVNTCASQFRRGDLPQPCDQSAGELSVCRCCEGSPVLNWAMEARRSAARVFSSVAAAAACLLPTAYCRDTSAT